MDVWRKLIISVETYTQSIYEWPITIGKEYFQFELINAMIR